MADSTSALAEPLLNESAHRGRNAFLLLSLLIGFAALWCSVPQHMLIQWPAITMAGMVQQPMRPHLLQPARVQQSTSAAKLARFGSPSVVQPVRLPGRASPVAVSISEFVDRSNDALVLNPGEWPDPEFVDYVRNRFPEAGVCTSKEARVLLEDGYTWLDVRTDQEWDEGHIPEGIAEHVPLITGSRRFDSETGTRVFTNQKANPAFIRNVQDIFPNKDAKILVACSDSRSRAMMALEALDEAGYTNIVGIKGGYLAWQKIYDSKFRRRRSGEVAEVFGHEGDTAGIHGSGAGTGMWDAAGGMSVEQTPTRDGEKWIDYFESLNEQRR